MSGFRARKCCKSGSDLISGRRLSNVLALIRRWQTFRVSATGADGLET